MEGIISFDDNNSIPKDSIAEDPSKCIEIENYETRDIKMDNRAPNDKREREEVKQISYKFRKTSIGGKKLLEYAKMDLSSIEKKKLSGQKMVHISIEI